MTNRDKLRSTAEQLRDALVEFLHREIVGPTSADEWIRESPCFRYTAGILFPQQQPVDETDDERVTDMSDASSHDEHLVHSGDDATCITSGEDMALQEEDREEGYEEGGRNVGVDESRDAGYDEPVQLASCFLPSVVGLSFAIPHGTSALQVIPHAAVYTAKSRRVGEHEQRGWARRELRLESVRIDLERSQQPIDLVETATQTESKAMGRDGAKTGLCLRVVVREPAAGQQLVTVVMLNSRITRDERVHADESFFQTEFEVRSLDGAAVFQELHADQSCLIDDEDKSLALLYEGCRRFAVGHGCAADWNPEHEGETEVTAVRTKTMPVRDLPPVEPRGGMERGLNMQLLSGTDIADADEEIPAALGDIAAQYEKWIDNLQLRMETVTERLRVVAQHHIDDCREVSRRIRSGIEFLHRNAFALECFRRANEAMLMQQIHYRRSRRSLSEDWNPLPESHLAGDDGSIGYWRAFQLAFLLMNLDCFAPDAKGDTRDVVDLIWFPTGGGKTEAYLGLAAYAIFMRRRLDPRNAGCTVLMRYTLRLLTAQQFQRASSLICACELIRRREPSHFGDTPISLGLWVGRSLSPNTRKEAVEVCNHLSRPGRTRRERARNPFQLLKCPWCGTALDESDALGYRVITRERTKTVAFVCPESRCPFSQRHEPIPVCVVDEDLYQQPPTLLIGTVDKLAMLAWRAEAGALFGRGTTHRDPPDLIIQDELHLISGPLGSMVGLYESVVDLLCSSGERRPKIVASTATIRRAEEQVRALYAREVCHFPPPGLEVSDSFFAKANPSRPSRRYVGILPTAAPLLGKAQVRVASALLQGIKSLPLPEGADESARDPYWTLVQYYGSLRELGRGLSLVDGDIPEYLQAMWGRGTVEPRELRRSLWAIELTSRRNAEEIPHILQQLEVPYASAEYCFTSRDRPVDTVLATNMISVGVDIDRLGLMLVVGQPRASSEYIQATSRVGRSDSAPGLIVTLYSPGRPRDRSHYEDFRSYHASFYRHVEPTSVTPFALPVLDRGLCALLVIVGRHIAGLDRPTQLDPSNHLLKHALKSLCSRVDDLVPGQGVIVDRRLQELIREWHSRKPAVWGEPYAGATQNGVALMYPASGELDVDRRGEALWATPTSLRSVDAECRAEPIYDYSLRDTEG